MAVADRIVDEELARMDALLDAERRGEWEPPDVPALSQRRSGRVLHAAPFQRWLEMLFVEERAKRDGSKVKVRVARRIGCNVRRLESYLTCSTVDENVVDRCTRNEGRYTVDDLYRAGSPFREGQPVASSPLATAIAAYWQAQTLTCASPYCKDRPAPESKFCVEHRDQLHRVKKAVEAEAQSFRSKINRPNARPMCTSPGCDLPRTPPAAFCVACLAEGAEEFVE